MEKEDEIQSEQEDKIPVKLQELEQELESLDPEIFEDIPDEKKKRILESLSITSIQEKMHSGPLPDADTLLKYDSVIPNGADRIMKMAEKQQSHRISIENKVIESQTTQSKVGQVFGFIIGVLGIGCGTFLAYSGETVVGSLIAGGTVISLVSVFVIGKRIQKKSLEE